MLPIPSNIWCCQPKGDRLRSPNSTTYVFLRLPIDGGPLSLRGSNLVALDTTDAESRPTVDDPDKQSHTNNHIHGLSLLDTVRWVGQGRSHRSH